MGTTDDQRSPLQYPALLNNSKVLFPNKSDFYCGKNYITAQENRPLVFLITDIKMPGMNEIELSPYLGEHVPACKIIVLTGYADFSYAQKAIKYGAFDFLLKPTSKEQVAEAVGRAVSDLDKQRQQVLTQQSVAQQFQESLPNQQAHFLLKLLHGTLQATDYTREMEKLELTDSPFYLIALQSEWPSTDGHTSSFLALQQEIGSILNEHLLQLLVASDHLVCCVALQIGMPFDMKFNNCYCYFLSELLGCK